MSIWQAEHIREEINTHLLAKVKADEQLEGKKQR